MLALLLAVSLYVTPPELQRAQASTVSVHAIVTKKLLVDEDGNPTSDGATKTINENVCSGFVAYTKPMQAPPPARIVYLSLVVTARHCTQPETLQVLGIDEMRVTLNDDAVNFKGGDRAPVVAMFAAPEGDDIAFLAVLSLHNHPAVWPALALPEQGESLFVYGMPQGQEFSYSPAVMMQDHHLYSDSDPSNPPWEHNSYMIACAACGPGDSGGPVFNMRGQVVGIVNAQGESAQTLMYPLDKLRRWLDVIGNPSTTS